MVKNSIFKRHQINFQPGSYVTVHLLNVPKSFLENHSPDAPISLYGMFPHEEKVRLYCIQYIALKFCKTLKNRSLSGSMQWFHCCLGLSFHQNIYNTSNQSINHAIPCFFSTDERLTLRTEATWCPFNQKQRFTHVSCRFP